MRTIMIGGTILTVIGCVALAEVNKPAPTDISGPARVIDGDTIEIKGQRIRLWGIDAPERSQTCTNRYGQLYPCGSLATKLIEILTANNAEVRCKTIDWDKYKRMVATCQVDFDYGPGTGWITVDIGRLMVSSGNAIDYTYYSKGYYAAEQANAVQHGWGMHQGAFQQPADYRHKEAVK